MQVDTTGQLKHGSVPWFGQSIVRSRGKIPYEVAQDLLEARRGGDDCSDATLGEICAVPAPGKIDAIQILQLTPCSDIIMNIPRSRWSCKRIRRTMP